MGNPLSIQKALLVVNLHKKNASEAAQRIKTELEKRKIEVDIFSFEGKPSELPEKSRDIVFSIGGDGTVLYAARNLKEPILPVNLGSLGFIAAVDMAEWQDVFDQYVQGNIKPSSRCMLEVTVKRNSEKVYQSTFLNDAVISASGIAKLIKLDVGFASGNNRGFLGSYRCDGLIAATPTGSTAYSMAAGGPILDPEMEAVIINPICPFTLSSRPFVLPSNQTIVITVAKEQRSGVLLTVDGQDTYGLECEDLIFITQDYNSARLIYADRHTYYNALRTKLFWPGDSNA